MAAAKAITFDFESGLSSVVVEGDSEIIVKALRSEDESFATLGHLISTANCLWMPFVLSLSHTCRLGNF